MRSWSYFYKKIILFIFGLLGACGQLEPSSLQHQPRREPASGKLSMLSFNINGIPTDLGFKRIGLTKKIARTLNQGSYDLVLLQENFSFDAILRRNLDFKKLSYQSVPKRRQHNSRVLLDGLDQFSRHPFSNPIRMPWENCHGDLGSYIGSRINGQDDCADCLAEKGFTFTRYKLTEGAEVDIYNLHMDAGDTSGDYEARRAQVEQLLNFVKEVSFGRAAILAGDFNISFPNQDTDKQTWDLIVNKLGQNYFQLATPTDLDPARQNLLPKGPDHILFHNSDQLRLIPHRYSYDLRFEKLSDHSAILAEFLWEKV